MAWKPDYATAAELAEYARADETVDETWLGLAVSAASRAIDRFTHRQFGKDDTPTERYYTARFDYSRGQWVVDIDDLMTDTGLEVGFDVDGDETYSGVIEDYRLLPRNAAAEDQPWTRIAVGSGSTVTPDATREGVKVTGTFGWSAVPDTIKQATLLQGDRVFVRRDSPFGVAGSPDIGSEIRLLAKLDPDVQVMVAEYRRRLTRVG